MKRPNAIVHMALWGGVTGWITAALLISFLYITFGASLLSLEYLFTLSAMVGGVVGVILGMIDGAIINFMLKDRNESNFMELRYKAQLVVSLLTSTGIILAMALLMSPYFLMSQFFPVILPFILIAGVFVSAIDAINRLKTERTILFTGAIAIIVLMLAPSPTILLGLLPIFLAVGLAVFATRSYFNRVGKANQKKLKNDASSQLEDKLKNDDDYFEEEAESRKHETS